MMRPVPSGDFFFWRLDSATHQGTWASGKGAEICGGRWNSKGVRAVYASADPSTAILEVAVHKGFAALDTVPHILTGAVITDTSAIHYIDESSIPNMNWLVPGVPGQGQQKFGDELLSNYPFILVPSTVSKYSWNILMNPAMAEGKYEVKIQERFALDTRLNPP